MTVTTFSCRELNQFVSDAERAANDGPVLPHHNHARNPLDVLRGSVISYDEPVRAGLEAAALSAGS